MVIFSFTWYLELLSVPAIQLMNNTFHFIISHCFINQFLTEGSISTCKSQRNFKIISLTSDFKIKHTSLGLHLHVFMYISAKSYSSDTVAQSRFSMLQNQAGDNKLMTTEECQTLHCIELKRRGNRCRNFQLCI